MKAVEFLEQTRALPLITRSKLTSDAPFIVLSPHPDDETLGLGGLIRQACSAKQSVDVIVLTDGAGSHTKSIKYPPHLLVELRKQEVLEAANILGLCASHVHHLDQPDANMPPAGPQFNYAVAEVLRLIECRNAKTLFVTWEHDPHCDHKAAAAIARAVIYLRPDIALFAYPIWGWHLPANDCFSNPPRGYRLDISEERAIKKQAIMAHRSQMTDLIDDDLTGFRFTDNTIAPFLDQYEFFYIAGCFDPC